MPFRHKRQGLNNTFSGLLQAQIANRGPVLQQLDSSARDHLHADFPGNILSRLQPAQRDSRQSSKPSSVNAQEGEHHNRSCTVIFFAMEVQMK